MNLPKAKSKRIALALALIVLTGLCLIPVYRAYRLHTYVDSLENKKPNILVISLCSLRMDRLHFYGAADKSLAPNIGRFFKESTFVYKNAFNSLGWTNITNFTYANMNPGAIENSGYQQLGQQAGFHLWRIPYRLTMLPEFAGQPVNIIDFEKNHKSVSTRLPQILGANLKKPFFTVVHFKYLHFPLIDRFNGVTPWDRYLEAGEKSRVIEYLKDPAKYHQKLPFLLFLANNPSHVLAHPRFKNLDFGKDPSKLFSLTGLMTNPELLAEWKASEDFELDLRILKKIYNANLTYIDEILGPLLDLYGNKKLKKNTIVIFAGDHGHSHMERDELTHGQFLWEQSLRIPLAIRFPGESGPKVIDTQVDYIALSKTFQQVMDGESSAAQFNANFQKNASDVLVLRNCMNTLRGVRYKNKYKYFVRIADGERFLFDLEKDPGEAHNLALELPAEADRMEVLYWRHLDSLVGVKPDNCIRGLSTIED